MSEMAERVAHAVQEVISRDVMYPDWLSQQAAMHLFLPLADAMARAAISAMREPTTEMCLIGRGHGFPCREIWRAMIDETLK